MGARKGAGKAAGVEHVVTLQPAEYVDHICDDGRELTKLPYPYHVRFTGYIDRQDFWRGTPLRVIGFVADLNRQEVDLDWDDAYKDPERAVGMYLVTEDAGGQMSTVTTAIKSVSVTEVDR